MTFNFKTDSIHKVLHMLDNHETVLVTFKIDRKKERAPLVFSPFTAEEDESRCYYAVSTASEELISVFSDPDLDEFRYK